METLISQDFEFNKLSLIYGKFLQEVHESYPEVQISDVSQHHFYKDQNTVFIHVAVPEPIAVILKLRFGGHLRDRPPPKPKPNWDEIAKEEIYKKKIREKEIYLEEERHRAKDLYFQDYISILKTRELENPYNYNKIEAIKVYLDLKKNYFIDWPKDEE